MGYPALVLPLTYELTEEQQKKVNITAAQQQQSFHKDLANCSTATDRLLTISRSFENIMEEATGKDPAKADKYHGRGKPEAYVGKDGLHPVTRAVRENYLQIQRNIAQCKVVKNRFLEMSRLLAKAAMCPGTPIEVACWCQAFEIRDGFFEAAVYCQNLPELSGCDLQRNCTVSVWGMVQEHQTQLEREWTTTARQLRGANQVEDRQQGLRKAYAAVRADRLPELAAIHKKVDISHTHAQTNALHQSADCPLRAGDTIRVNGKQVQVVAHNEHVAYLADA